MATKPTTKTEDAARDAAADTQEEATASQSMASQSDTAQHTHPEDEETNRIILPDGTESVKRSRISMTALGNPRVAAGLPEGTYHVVGFISGQAFGTEDKFLQDGTPTKALVGEFTGVTADKKKVIESGVLYFPQGIHHEILSAVLQGHKPEFSLEVRTRKDSNPSGYTYELVNLMPPVVSNNRKKHLALMFEKIDDYHARQAAQLAAPQAGQMPLLRG